MNLTVTRYRYKRKIPVNPAVLVAIAALRQLGNKGDPRRFNTDYEHKCKGRTTTWSDHRAKQKRIARRRRNKGYGYPAGAAAGV